MGTIKSRFSRVFSKANDSNRTKIYKGHKVSKPTFNFYLRNYESGNAGLKNTAVNVLRVYHTQKFKIPQKCCETMRLCMLKKINNTIPGITKEDYCLRYTKYPHQYLCYHTIASGARADRISQGMRNAYGKAFTRAYKPKNALSLFIEIYLSKKYQKVLSTLKEPITKVMHKCPVKTISKIESTNAVPMALKTDPLAKVFKKPKSLPTTKGKHYRSGRT